MPYYLAIGVSYERFMDSCPKELEPFLKAYKLRKNNEDAERWQLGQYVTAAVGCLFKGKYPDKPMFQMESEINHNGYKESNEDVAVYEMKIRTKALEKMGLPQSPM